MKPNQKEFNNKCKEFNKGEKRGSYYDLANEIFKDHPIQACMLIIAVWNGGYFSKISNKGLVLKKFKFAFKKCGPLFKKLKGKKLSDVNLENKTTQENIKKIYSILSKIKGIKHTGASKVMHLVNKELFIMWDSYINGNHPKEHYEKLNLNYKKYKRNTEGYLEFLKDMKKNFENLKNPSKIRTFAKCIDEYNYMIYTKPIKRIEKKNKKISKQ